MPQIIIGCKLPNGLILELDDKRVILNGANSAIIIGGHGITENVDADFWAAWLAKNKGMSFVKAGHVFAHEKPANVAAQAKERASEKTGFEGANPEAPGAGLEKVKTTKV